MAHTKLKNRVPAAILRSPAHRMLSSKTLLLSYTGRRSGRRYATPVNYHQRDDAILVATDSAWWRNFRTPAPATVLVRGTKLAVIGEVLGDPDEAATALAEIVRAQPSYGRWAHVRVEAGEPNGADVRAEIARGRRVIRLSPEG
ncbi:MAG TPA: nitroreductase/quinone reductase family protein [Acidimicrobiales bacterium]|jgi:deazaflavin-dependent oxidoreductase (nitroreductase family)|nr:nitroreductase/quinone reductase family protein [Acidimicrobiales bacterium]